MHLNIQLLLWIANPALELPLAAAMVWRKLHRKFPAFFAYIIFQLINFAVLFPIHQYGDYVLYFYSYWIGAIITLGLGFKVIHEVFLDVFRPYHTLKDLGTVLFKWAALVMLFVAIVVAAASPAGQSPLPQAVATVQRCVKVIQCGLVVFLLVFARYLGVSWRQHTFGIVLGFGGYASVQLLGNALYAGGQIGTPATNVLYPAAYSGALLTWLAYAVLKAPSKELSSGLLTSQRWEQSLSDLQHPVPSDSLIPMFEGMVDRAFSRTAAEPYGETAATQHLTQENSSPHLSPASQLPPSFSVPRLSRR
jgi:hypothetical protein